jgi:hypothetical protein
MILQTLRASPELGVFLAVGLGYWLGSQNLGNFSLGTVTAALLFRLILGNWWTTRAAFGVLPDLSLRKRLFDGTANRSGLEEQRRPTFAPFPCRVHIRTGVDCVYGARVGVGCRASARDFSAGP